MEDYEYLDKLIVKGFDEGSKQLATALKIFLENTKFTPPTITLYPFKEKEA